MLATTTFSVSAQDDAKHKQFSLFGNVLKEDTVRIGWLGEMVHGGSEMGSIRTQAVSREPLNACGAREDQSQDSKSMSLWR